MPLTAEIDELAPRHDPEVLERGEDGLRSGGIDVEFTVARHQRIRQRGPVIRADDELPSAEDSFPFQLLLRPLFVPIVVGVDPWRAAP